MANFFKEYQAEVKAKREAEEQAKRNAKKGKYRPGQVVYINPVYDAERNGKRFFADYSLSKGYVLLAEDKKSALRGEGFIYHESVIVR